MDVKFFSCACNYFVVMLISILHADQITKKSKEKEESAYLKAGSVATEVLSSLRTVLAFGGEYKEEKRLFSVLVF